MAVESDSESERDITRAPDQREAVRPVGRLDQLSYYPALLETVTQLAGEDATAGRSPHAQRRGYRPPKRTAVFTGQQVRNIISKHAIRENAKAAAVLTT